MVTVPASISVDLGHQHLRLAAPLSGPAQHTDIAIVRTEVATGDVRVDDQVGHCLVVVGRGGSDVRVGHPASVPDRLRRTPTRAPPGARRRRQAGE